MRTFWGILLVALLLTTNKTFAAETTIIARVGNDDLAPFFWRENGEWKGIDIDFYQALEQASGIRFKFEKLPWSRAISYMKSGECQIMTQLSKTPEREHYMEYLGPYATEDMVLVVKKERISLPIGNLTELVEQAKHANQLIGIEKDAFYSNEFNERLKSDSAFAAQFIYAKMTLGQMVLHDRLFGSFDRRVVISHQLKSDSAYNGLAIHPYQISSGPVFFGVSKKTPAKIVEALQAACNRLMADGTFRHIDARWNIR